MTIACLSDPIQRSKQTGTHQEPRTGPSSEVRRQTKALLASAALSSRLPRSMVGILVTEKNTFFHVQPTEAVESNGWLSDSDSGIDAFDKKRVLRAPPRKQTDSHLTPTVANSFLRRMSTSSQRCRSCPPTTPSTPSPTPAISIFDDSEPRLSDSSTPPLSPPRCGLPALAEEIPGFCAPPSAAPHPPTLYTFAPSTPQVIPPTQYTPQPLPLMSLLGDSENLTVSEPQQQQPIEKTTVMLRNVPYHEGQVGVLRLLESRGFLGKFDFFYAPLDFNSSNNLGYAFINFRSALFVAEFFKDVDGLRVNQFDGWAAKELKVCWARVQGLAANVEHYRNSPVNEMPAQFRPMVFDSCGGQVDFPRPDAGLGSGAVRGAFFCKSPPRRNSFAWRPNNGAPRNELTRNQSNSQVSGREYTGAYPPYSPGQQSTRRSSYHQGLRL